MKIPLPIIDFGPTIRHFQWLYYRKRVKKCLELLKTDFKQHYTQDFLAFQVNASPISYNLALTGNRQTKRSIEILRNVKDFLVNEITKQFEKEAWGTE
jgi:hypothetical protein